MHFGLLNSGLQHKIVDQPLFFAFQNTYATDCYYETEGFHTVRVAQGREGRWMDTPYPPRAIGGSFQAA